MIVKHGRNIFGETSEVRRGLWTFFFLIADWLGRQTPINEIIKQIKLTMNRHENA